jgi:hypothetical protein
MVKSFIFNEAFLPASPDLSKIMSTALVSMGYGRF